MKEIVLNYGYYVTLLSWLMNDRKQNNDFHYFDQIGCALDVFLGPLLFSLLFFFFHLLSVKKQLTSLSKTNGEGKKKIISNIPFSSEGSESPIQIMVVYFPFLPVSSGIYTSIPFKKKMPTQISVGNWSNKLAMSPLSPVTFNMGYFELLRTTICLEGRLLLSSKH